MKHSTSKNFPKRQRIDLSNTPIRCACGGGQSCIVDRRKARDWVHEDDVFKAAGWRAPAKHVRGTIFSSKTNWFSWTGPNYLI